MKLYRSRKVISAGLIIIVGITFHSCKYDTFENEPCQLKIPDEVSFHADILPVLGKIAALSVAIPEVIRLVTLIWMILLPTENLVVPVAGTSTQTFQHIACFTAS